MADERSTVEAFAAAVARMADPFANRAKLLEAMVLDELGWQQLDATWRAEIARRAATGDRSLADAFTAAFASERDRIEQQRAHSRPAARSTHATPPTDVDETAIAVVMLEPALPFAGARQPPPPAADVTMHDSDLDSTAIMTDDGELGLTLPFDEDR